MAIAYGVDYLRMISLFYLFCFSGNIFVGYFRGISRMLIPLVGTIMHISIRVALSHLLVNAMGLRAVALATGTGWVCLAVYQILWLRKCHRDADA